MVAIVFDRPILSANFTFRASMRILVAIAFILIIGSLASALVFLMKDKGKSKVLGTPAVPQRYPNLETPTQVSSSSVRRTSGSVLIDTGRSILRLVGL